MNRLVQDPSFPSERVRVSGSPTPYSVEKVASGRNSVLLTGVGRIRGRSTDKTVMDERVRVVLTQYDVREVPCL